MEEASACSRNWVIFQALIQSFITFLVIHGVIKNRYCCPKCWSMLKLYKYLKFRDKSVYTSGGQILCRVLSSGLKGTFFEHSRIQRRAFTDKGIHLG